MNTSFALVLVIAGQAGQGVDQAWADKARSALPELIERRLQLSSRLDEVHEYTSKAEPGAQAKGGVYFNERTSVDETSRLGDNLLVKSTTRADEKSQQETLVLCRNAHYNFKLTKRGVDGKYALISHSSGPPMEDIDRSAHKNMIQEMQGILSVLENKDKHTTLRRLAWDAERSLVILDYVVRPDDPKRVLEDRCLFDPARGWAPVETVRKTWSGRFENRYEYGIDVEGLMFPYAIENKGSYHVPDAPPSYVIRQVIRSLKPTKTTERNYRLTAFGLPEPADAPPLPQSGLPTYVYILAGSAACAALSLACRYFVKRQKK